MIRPLLMVAWLSILGTEAGAQMAPRFVRGDVSHRPPLVLGEHADGGEIPAAVGALTLAGLMVYDIATAPGSVRARNASAPDASPRSGATALRLSAAGTLLPIGLGILAYDRDLPRVGSALILTGAVAGPGAGHWYAGERRRVLRNAGLRAALLLGTLYLEGCCT